MTGFVAALKRGTVPRSVLVIIKNATIRELVASHLRHARLLPILAASAEEGRRLAAEVRPDVVLVDADAPATAPWFDTTLQPPIDEAALTVVLSSHATGGTGGPSGDRQLWFNKPFAPSEVVCCLVKHFSSTAATVPAPAESTLRLGPLELDHPRCEVRITRSHGTDVVSLPGTEMALLRCLMENEGRVVSREQIIAATRGPDHAVDVRTVDQSIKRLRKHLGDGRSRTMIQTQRGYGYRLSFGPLDSRP